MLPLFRALRFLPVFLLAFSFRLRAQDMAVRVEAVRLLEHANAVSRPAHILPNHMQEVTFRAYHLDGTTQDGTYNVIYSGDIERYDIVFGDYHAISLHFPDKIVQNAYQPPPPEALEVDNLTPVLIGRFDKSDTIHSIAPATLFGRRAKCIQFETVNGRTHQSNEICVDEELGTLIRRSVGEDLVENTDYSLFAGILLPAHIRHYINGKLRMEIEQKFSVIDGPIDWAELTPPHPTTFGACQQYRRPIIQSAPQPATAGAGPWYDVQVHGVIGEDGHVHQASVLTAGRNDLEQQAVQIVSGWVFSPGVCNGKPIPVSADLIVHFPPQ
ncbi:MAG TPA: energy transducer TonB [Candidatus Angelobacter sp.]|nr:energy transducer TonB [Candidatus Angelobacter sp.]